jgi:hypothetical protein
MQKESSMSSRSKAKNVRKYANAPAPSMQDLVRQVSGLMQSGFKEDLRDQVQPEQREK